jgi:hypothetical protein
MEVESFGYITDPIFPAFDSEVLDRGSHIIVRTPSNPTFYRILPLNTPQLAAGMKAGCFPSLGRGN